MTSLTPSTIGSLTLTPFGSDEQHVRATDALNVEADSDASGAGDLVFKTGGVERARISAAGVGTGWPDVLGGSVSLAPRTTIQSLLSGTTFISRFQSGHGWTLTQNAGTIADDTATASLFATQSLKVTAATSGSAPFAQKGSLALDLTTNPLVIWVKWDIVTPETDFVAPAFTVFAGNSALTNTYSWTYYLGSAPGGSINGQPVPNADGWTGYELFISDATVTGSPTIAAIDTIRIRFGNNSGVGYFGGIGQRTLPTTQYPNGVVTIHFDDSIDNTFTRAMPVLDKYGFNACSNTIVSQVDSGAGWATMAQLHQAQDYHGWEIAGHAFTKTNHDLRFTNIDAATLTAEFVGLKKWMLDNGFVSDFWASPGGQANLAVWTEARKYFALHRGVGGPGGSINRVAWLQSAKPVYPGQVWAAAFDTATYTVAVMQAMITSALAAKSWLHLTFHTTLNTTSSGAAISTTDLDTICASIQSSGMAVRTVKQVLALA